MVKHIQFLSWLMAWFIAQLKNGKELAFILCIRGKGSISDLIQAGDSTEHGYISITARNLLPLPSQPPSLNAAPCQPCRQSLIILPRKMWKSSSSICTILIRAAALISRGIMKTCSTTGILSAAALSRAEASSRSISGGRRLGTPQAIIWIDGSRKQTDSGNLEKKDLRPQLQKVWQQLNRSKSPFLKVCSEKRLRFQHYLPQVNLDRVQYNFPAISLKVLQNLLRFQMEVKLALLHILILKLISCVGFILNLILTS